MTDPIRLDPWLDVACLFKTRSEAKRACEAGKVSVNDRDAKPNRMVRDGDRIRINRRPSAGHQDVVVRLVIDQHVKKAEAEVLYDDVTPKPTAEEIGDAKNRASLPRRHSGRRHARPQPAAGDCAGSRNDADALPTCHAIRKSSDSGRCFTRSNRLDTASRSRRWLRNSG